MLTTDQMSFNRAVRIRRFWTIVLMDSLSAFGLFYLAGTYFQLGDMIGEIDEKWLRLIGALCGFASGIFKVFWGYIFDKHGFRWTYNYVLLIELTMCLFVTIVVRWGPFCYAIWVFMGFICLGAHFVIFPAVLVRVFGLKAGIKLYSVVYLSKAVTALLVIGLW